MSASFKIRDYSDADFEVLYQIDQRCFLPGIAYPRDELRYYISLPRTRTLVAEVDGTIAAFIIASVNPDRRMQRRTGHIITLDVLREYRRQRLGSRLLEQAERYVQESGCQGVLLETAVDNESAQSFYLQHGYKILQTLPGYYLGSLDAYLLGKAFSGSSLQASGTATKIPVDPGEKGL